ncbi:hypothetical protein ACFL1I_00095 [Candidatus Omnitrophota bacterium]
MKKNLIILFLLWVSLAPRVCFAETVSVTASSAFSVAEVFTLEFYDREPGKYLYSTEIPFTNMDPSKTWVLADGRREGDGKNDLGLLCSTNLGETWYLKIHGSPNNVFLSKIQYGLWRPWNLNAGAAANGNLNEGWIPLPAAAVTVYSAGSNDLNNLGPEAQQGTLCGFSFAVDPSRLDPKTVHRCTIQFTLTTNI